MFFLPKDIIRKIFEYDITYHNIYKNVQEEFFKCSRCWRLVSDRYKEEESIGWYYRQRVPYNMSYNAAKKLANYWNYEYKNDKRLGRMYLNWVENHENETNIDYKYLETWFDVEQNKSVNRTMRNIKQNKSLLNLKII